MRLSTDCAHVDGAYWPLEMSPKHALFSFKGLSSRALGQLGSDFGVPGGACTTTGEHGLVCIDSRESVVSGLGAKASTCGSMQSELHDVAHELSMCC